MNSKKLFPEAGRELDALIAEKVMGWRWATVVNISMLFPQWFWESEQVESRPALYQVGKVGAKVDYDNYWLAKSSPHLPKVPPFSTDVESAISAFEHHFTEWEIERLANGMYVATAWIGDQKFEAKAKTLPLAVCRAALLPLAASEISAEGDSSPA